MREHAGCYIACSFTSYPNHFAHPSAFLNMKKKSFFILGILLVLGPLGFSATSLIIKRSELTYNIPNTPEAKEIMKTIEKAYDIEAEAAYTFDLTKFPTVFINDPRFPVSSGTLKTIRKLTNNPTLESAGWLDYKLAYYSWISSATLHSESVQSKAKAKNRALTEEERKSLIDADGRIAPARAEDPIRQQKLKFMSVSIIGDIAKVILNDGPTTIELSVVFVDKQWYIAGIKGIAFHP
jgi:hypothetical protein